MELELLTPSGAPEFSPVCVTRSLLLCVMFCIHLFVLLLLAIVLSVLLRFTDSDYPFGIFKSVLQIIVSVSYWCKIIFNMFNILTSLGEKKNRSTMQFIDHICFKKFICYNLSNDFYIHFNISFFDFPSHGTHLFPHIPYNKLEINTMIYICFRI